jgi:hypothetical protein
MWRRAYLFLVLVRLYFALSPSYLHPDENFQGPEVIAGKSAAVWTASMKLWLGSRGVVEHLGSHVALNLHIPADAFIDRSMDFEPSANTLSLQARSSAIPSS